MRCREEGLRLQRGIEVAPRTGALHSMNGDTVVRIVNRGRVTGQQTIIVHAGTRCGAGNGTGRAERRLTRQLQA